MALEDILPIVVTSFAPAVVAIANNIYQYHLNKQNNEFQIKLSEQETLNQIKLKEFDYLCNERTKAVNEYVEIFYDYLSNRNKDNLTKLKLSTSKVLPYVSGYAHECITNIIGVIDSPVAVSDEELETQLQSFLNALINETSISKK